MKVTRTAANGSVDDVIVDVASAAKVGAILSAAESTIRADLAAAGIPVDTANEIAVAAYEGGYNRAIIVGILPDIAGRNSNRHA